MTKDLEETLAELGPGYREVVDRLRTAQNLTPVARPFRPIPYLAAATVVALLGLASVLTMRESSVIVRHGVYTAAYEKGAEALSSIVSAQRADGSWANDFLTRQNAAALRGASSEEMKIAYKKAVRYLKLKGLRPLTDEELEHFAARAREMALTVS